MAGVFISYRRDDSGGYAGRLFDVLSARFGADQTFMDLDDIKGGDDFTAVIGEKIGQCSALLAIIGERWLTASTDGRRRLDSPGDFVRLEIAKALERRVRVIPVLVGGATMPRREDLPDALAALAVHQAVEVRDAHFHADAGQLIDLLEKTVPGLVARPPGRPWRRWWPAAAGIASVAVVTGVLATRQPLEHAASSPAAVAPAAPAVNVAGRWKGTVKYDWGDSHGETFEFEVTGRELNGTATFLGYPRGILDGRVEGNRVTFTTKTLTSLGDKTYQDTNLYKGVVEGTSIRFTMMTDSAAESHAPVRFIVERSNP